MALTNVANVFHETSDKLWKLLKPLRDCGPFPTVSASIFQTAFRFGVFSEICEIITMNFKMKCIEMPNSSGALHMLQTFDI